MAPPSMDPNIERGKDKAAGKVIGWSRYDASEFKEYGEAVGSFEAGYKSAYEAGRIDGYNQAKAEAKEAA